MKLHYTYSYEAELTCLDAEGKEYEDQVELEQALFQLVLNRVRCRQD